MRETLHQTTLHPNELMKSDLLSEVLLLGGGTALVLSFVIVVVAALASWLVPA
jgi:hypothetical protein